MKSFIWQNHPWLLLSLLIIISLFVGEHSLSQLQYQRQAIMDGQVYRLITAHLVHTNNYHVLLNLTGLIFIGVLAQFQLGQRDWWLTLLVSALIVSVGLILFNPELQWYRGLSGVLHGVAIVLILKARQLAGFIRAIVLIALTTKIVLEQLHIGLWQSEQLIGSTVIVDAHLYGVIGGLVSYMILQLTRSKKMFRKNF